jgi:hypothetical protein
MTKKEALSIFKEEVLPTIIKKYGKDDVPARCEGWNDFTDYLCKDGQITTKQYSAWVNPF